MGLVRGLFVRKDATRGTTPVEARKALAGLITPAGAFGARPGVLSGLTVTGTAAWTYAIAAGHQVTSRGVSDGVVLAANDGATTVATTAAPGTGGRIDIIWVKHSDVDAGDATSGNDFGVTSGVVSGTPVAPALPAGAMEVARATVLAGATSTSHANVTITNTAQRTGLRGGIIDVPDVAARLALGNPAAGAVYYVHEHSTDILWRNAGAAWEQIYPALSRPHVWLARTTALNFAAASPIVVAAWDIVDASVLSIVNATGIVTVPVAGWYDVSFGFHWTANAAGGRTAQVIRTRAGADVPVLADNRDNSGTRPTPMSAAATMRLEAGDTLRLSIVHSGSVTMGPDVAAQPVYFSVTAA